MLEPLATKQLWVKSMLLRLFNYTFFLSKSIALIKHHFEIMVMKSIGKIITCSFPEFCPKYPI
jgi:hypothetical protein